MLLRRNTTHITRHQPHAACFPAPTVEQGIMGKISVSGWCLVTLSLRRRQTRMLALSVPHQLELPLQQAGPNEESRAGDWRRAGSHRSPACSGHSWAADMGKPGDRGTVSSSSIIRRSPSSLRFYPCPHLTFELWHLWIPHGQIKYLFHQLLFIRHKLFSLLIS